MRLASRFLPFVLCLLLPQLSFAQYIYIDTNGDGLPGTGDVLQASGETTLDIWLRTDGNRDGSSASCIDPSATLAINSYSFILKAQYGTMNWGALVNRLTEIPTAIGAFSNATDYFAGFYGGPNLPPGTYRLASLPVSVATGTPELEFASATDLPAATTTGFGSECPGPYYDYYMKLGVEWFDSDGVSYSGQVNHPPGLSPIPDLVVAEAATADQSISATDSDGDPLTFSKIAGPPYMTVATVDAGSGTAAGVIHLAPGYTDAGPATGRVAVTDGAVSDSASFAITVENTDRPPVLEQPLDMEIAAGTEDAQTLIAADPDGQPLQFLKIDGPRFMSVQTYFAQVGLVRTLPDRDVFGQFVGVVGASDGELMDQKSFGIRVHGAITLDQPADMAVVVQGTAQQTLRATDPEGVPLSFTRSSGPSFVAVTTTDPGAGAATGLLRAVPGEFDAGLYFVSVTATDGVSVDEKSLHVRVVNPGGQGALARRFFAGAFLSSEAAFNPQCVALADFNEDGIPDVATVDGLFWDLGVRMVTILLGNGDGTFARFLDIYVGDFPARVACADLNHDGHVDLAAVTNNSRNVAVLLGAGDGTFGPMAQYPTASNCHDVTFGDWNGDGAPDLAVVSNRTDRLYIYLNAGDGTFAGRQEYPTGRYPDRVFAGDVTGDGHDDLLVHCFDDGSVQLFRGRTDGSFEEPALVPAAAGLSMCGLVDVDQDGFLDILGVEPSGGSVAVARGAGDGSFLDRDRWPVGSRPSDAATGDVDRDGIPDLVVTDFNDDTVSFLRGLGGGSFAPRKTCGVGPGPVSVRLADFDLDGILDAVSASRGSTTITTLIGTEAGGFEPNRESPGMLQASAAAELDWSGDGRPDLALGNPFQHALSLFAARADGTFEAGPVVPIAGVADRIVGGDWDRDGVPDLAILDRYAGTVTALRGQGGGAFTQTGVWPLGFIPGSMIAVDFDQDGSLDLALAGGYLGGITLLRGQADGTFTIEAAPAGINYAQDLLFADFTEDGILDLATSSFAGGAVYRGVGDGTFQPGGAFVSLDEAPAHLAAADLDGDGHLDLAFALEDSSRIVTAWGNGDGTFAEPASYSVARTPTRIVAADWNGDGLTDLAAACTGANVVTLLMGGTGRNGFGSRIDVGCGSVPIAAFPGDWNGDGFLDVVTVDARRGTITTLLNRGLLNPNHPPVADAGGPYRGVAGAPIEISGAASTDPDGDALQYLWSLGDGATAVGPAVLHVYGEGGVYSIVLEVRDGSAVARDTTSATVSASLPARAFRSSGRGVFPTMGGAPTLCYRLESVENDFSIESLAPSSLRLVSPGTGTVSEIPAVEGKSARSGDTDRNGVPERQVCFARADLEQLFSLVASRRTVALLIRGRLLSGAIVEAAASLTVIGPSDVPQAFAYPNPFNPEGRIGFSVPAAGPVTVRVFDATGRLVITLLESQPMPAGYHEIPVKARDGLGRSMGSGVYLYRVETARGATSGRFVVIE